MHALFHVLWYPLFLGETRPVLLVVGTLVTLFGVLALVRGVFDYLDRRIPRSWPWLCGSAFVLSLALGIAGLEATTAVGPLWLTLALGQVASGIVILWNRSYGSLGSWLAGSGLILAGLHMADYPLLGHIPAVVPWGVMVESWLRLACGFGLVLLQIERATRQRERLEKRLEHAAKLEAIGRLASGVAHDFNNLLTVISAQSSLARLEADENTQEALAQIDEATARSAKLARHLLAFSRPPCQRLGTVDLAALVRNMTPMVRTAVHGIIELEISAPGPAHVAGDESQLEHLVLNLAINARDAMPSGGRCSIAVRMRRATDLETQTHGLSKRVVELEVSDTGHGMTDEVKAHIFEPFYTTKSEDEGSGLGLFTVYATVRAHGGLIEVHSEPERGTRFTIVLPRTTPTNEAESRPAP